MIFFSVGACVVLHNIAIQLREPLPEDDDVDLPDDAGDLNVTGQEEDGRSVRDFVARKYFNA